MSVPIERWATIPGYEGYYEVSDRGRLRSRDRVVIDALGREQRIRGRALDPYVSPPPGSRREANLRCRGERRIRFVAALVLEAFVGPRPPGADACHNNGNSTDDRLENLRWASRSENILDAVGHGTHINARKTHCPREHLLSAPNLTGSRGRRCLACERARGNVRWGSSPQDFLRLADEHYARIMGRSA